VEKPRKVTATLASASRHAEAFRQSSPSKLALIIRSSLDCRGRLLFHKSIAKVETMNRAMRLSAVLIILFCVAQASAGKSGVRRQTVRSLAGEWIVVSSPINGQTTSPKGVTLGFPDRDMIFAQQGELRTGVVLREDVGPNVRPLGVWRVSGDQFSTTFQLWCPDANGPCGSIVMRGQFVRDDKINGTMTAFFNVADDSTPTGFDTWTFSFVGNRVAVSAPGGSN
jgi:hypothetical protein